MGGIGTGPSPDFTQDWDYERGITRKLLHTLTDGALGQAARLGGRTLGRLAWHLILTILEMPGEAGISTEGPHIGDNAPLTAAALASQYSETAQRLRKAVATHWTGATLAEDVPRYGEVWKKGQVLGAPINTKPIIAAR